jgi:hypothetical protein
MIPPVRVIRHADEMTEDQLAEYKRQHPARDYIQVVRVDGRQRDNEPTAIRSEK